MHEMHWKRVGSAGNAKERVTAHFWVSVAIENSLSLCHAREFWFYVATVGVVS